MRSFCMCSLCLDLSASWQGSGIGLFLSDGHHYYSEGVGCWARLMVAGTPAVLACVGHWTVYRHARCNVPIHGCYAYWSTRSANIGIITCICGSFPAVSPPYRHSKSPDPASPVFCPNTYVLFIPFGTDRQRCIDQPSMGSRNLFVVTLGGGWS
jgi:hypothetical protein